MPKPMTRKSLIALASVVGLSFAGCEPTCDGDGDCPGGEVCELSTGCESPTQCVAGCHDDSQCQRGEFCNQIQCFTCPCAGSCEPREETCENDGDCASGLVCEPTTGCQLPQKCTPGCREDSQCPAGLICNQVLCITCPCAGICQPPQ